MSEMRCSQCNNLTTLQDSLRVDYETVCSECLIDYVPCVDCGALMQPSDPVVIGDGNALCSDCADNYVSCECCGELYMEGDLIHTQDGLVCENCLEDYRICDDCGDYANPENMCEIGGSVVCSSCEDNYVSCDNCDEYCHIDEMTITAFDNLCPSCAELPYCVECDARIPEYEETSLPDGSAVCPSCYSEYYGGCTECGDVYLVDSLTWRGDGFVCSDCREDVEDEIRSYTYKPTPIFHGNSSRSELHLGIELEVDSDDYINSADAIYGLNKEFDGSAYYKSDGSLDHGFEIVTHPMTPRYAMDLDWGTICETLINEGFRSHDKKTCGIHIHVNKEYFGASEVHQDLGIMKVLHFYERFWDSIVVFSRRTEYQIERWANRYGILDPDDLLSTAKGSGRYHAINLQNRYTIEHRIFRGSLKSTTVLATIQFVAEVSRICKESSIEEVQLMTWGGFCNKLNSRYTELTNYLSARGISGR